jgi:putative flippase GtrA
MVALVELAAVRYAPAAAASAALGAAVVFALNRWWAFRDRSPLRLAQVARFGVVAGGSCALNAGLVHLLAGALHLAYLGARLGAACLVFAVWTYPVQSRLVFAPAHRSSS